jgi:hypothetical protein
MTPIFLTKEISAQQKFNNRYYLWQLIPENSIVVTEHVMYQVDQLPAISTYISNLDNPTIYFDLSHNPEILESQHTINIFDQLKKFAPLKILVNEYKKFYTPDKNFIYYPAFFYAYSHGTYLEPTTVVNLPRFIKKTKSFMSLNNRAVWHRIWLFAELASNNLLDNIDYSFVWNPKTNQPNQLDQLPEYKYNQAMSMLDQLPIRLAEEKNGNFVSNAVVLGLGCYNECAVNIVTESCPNLGFLTEKICKALASYQIPILLSHTSATQFCVDAGFDMFEDIIPWRTWDSIEDEKERCAVACKFVVDYIKHGDALSDWNKCRDRVIANRERLTSDDFKKFCTAQFDF